MGTRFENLEFGDERREEGLEPGRPPDARPDARAYLARAEEAYRWGEFEKALRLFTRCLEEDRSTVRAWVGQVQMLVQLGEHREARIWSDKALELFRSNGELLAAKAQACIRLGDHRAAWAANDGAMGGPGTSPYRWEVRGEVLLAGRQKLHEECFRKALADAAADWFDRVVIARIYAYYDQTANALRYLKEALELEPAHGYIWYERGHCERALGLEAAAARSYRRCLELRPDYRAATVALQERPPSFWERMRRAWKRWNER